MSISQQLIEFERARGTCFKLLAACFYQPQKKVFLEEGLFPNLTSLLKLTCPGAAGFSERMGEAILLYGDEDLLVEYAKLFIGPYELKAAPYGSVYLEDAGKIMGDSTMEVLRMYEAEGLSIDEKFMELPDHIAAELEFMYYLAFNEVAALENSDMEKAYHFINTQEMFLDRFLGKWVGLFCGRIADGTGNEFYKALAGCLRIFILASAPHDDLRSLLQEEARGTHN